MNENQEQEEVFEPPSDERFYVTLRDGVPREIRFSLAAMKTLKRQFGNKSALKGELFQALDEDTLPAILWEVLTPESRGGLSGPGDLEQHIDAPTAGYVIRMMGKAFKYASPKPKNGARPQEETRAVIQ